MSQQHKEELEAFIFAGNLLKGRLVDRRTIDQQIEDQERYISQIQIYIDFLKQRTAEKQNEKFMNELELGELRKKSVNVRKEK